MPKQRHRPVQIFASLALLAGLFAATAFFTGNVYWLTSLWYNFAEIDDYKIFSNDSVATHRVQAWPLSVNYNQASLPNGLQKYLESIETTALVVVKNDSLAYECYWDDHGPNTVSGSFSVAKSITGLLAGFALQNGHIQSLDQPVKDFIPSFTGGLKDKVTIRHLLTMTSGSDFNESYINPFSKTAELYYGTQLLKTATSVSVTQKPGTQFRYKSGDTQLLGMVIEQATQTSLASYASEKLWKPLGAENTALWSVDKPGGHAKAYCCFNASARDFARLGLLMLRKGKWKKQHLLDSQYIALSVRPHKLPDSRGNACNYYGYQWWVSPGNPDAYYARGILGQYILVFPQLDAVVVRLGKKRSESGSNFKPALLDQMHNWLVAW